MSYSPPISHAIPALLTQTKISDFFLKKSFDQRKNTNFLDVSTYKETFGTGTG